MTEALHGTPEPANDDASPRWQSILKSVMQVGGFGVGVALMVWCVAAALSPENQAQLARLRDASAGQVAALLALSTLVVLVGGTVFQQVLSPVRSLPMLGVQATNAIASLLALLPFKLSVVFRVIVHNRRDKVPLLTIGAWFSAAGVIILLTLLPVLASSIWREHADAIWLASSLGGIALAIGTMLIIARLLSTGKGWETFTGLWSRLALPRALKSPGLMERVHEGVRMLASPRAVITCVALRTFDVGVQATRFKIAAVILGQPLLWDQAILAGAAFFLIGAIAPTGQLGAREGGTAAVLHMVLPNVELRSFMPIVLTVSAAETVVLLVGSMAALAYLRPDRLLRLGNKPKS